MAIERERKFRVLPELLPPEALKNSYEVEAGYFTNGPIAIRVTSRASGRQKICFKGPGTQEREEFEYLIPNEDAQRLLMLAPTNLKKTRYEFEGWEIDHFHVDEVQTSGPLWVAEWEEAPGKQPIPSPLPPWIGLEVTEDVKFTNMRLAWMLGKR